MLTIYRRHRDSCLLRRETEIRVHLEGDLFLRKGKKNCACPLWVDGFFAGGEFRKSVTTRDWKKAVEKVHEWIGERNNSAIPIQPITIKSATEKFLTDARSRQLAECTIYKYRLLFRQVSDFSNLAGIRFLKELDLVTLDKFRANWKDGPRSSLKKLERLRAFLRFAEKRKWITENPALDMKAPKISNRPTMPFTGPMMQKILAAFDSYCKRAGVANAQRLKAFVLLLRYSGMRIGDAVRCHVDQIDGNRLFLYTQKTGVPVQSILPDFVLRELAAAPKSSAKYFFWTGESKLHSAISKWQRRLQVLFRLADLPDGHAHRFRDTFAVELLLAGIPIERVSVLLGHQSIRVTERHYSPWVRARQEQLEADLERVWGQDPVISLEKKGTNQVHQKSDRPN